MHFVSTVVIPSLVILIAATVPHRLDFVALAPVFFLSQLTLVMPVLAWARRKARGYAAA